MLREIVVVRNVHLLNYIRVTTLRMLLNRYDSINLPIMTVLIGLCTFYLLNNNTFTKATHYISTTRYLSLSLMFFNAHACDSIPKTFSYRDKIISQFLFVLIIVINIKILFTLY